MGKQTSDAEFLARYRERNPQGAGMKLNLPPSGKNKSLDQLVDGQATLNDAPRPTAEVTPLPGLSSPAAAVEPTDKLLGRMISIDLLDSHPWNARVHRSAERVRELASEIAADGQNAPILITPNPDSPGRHFVVDGETRFKSLKLLHRTEAWVLDRLVDPSNPAAFYAASFKQTDSTEKISAIDQGIRWGQLIEGGFASSDSIAELLGVNQSTVSRMLSYRRFPESVLEFMHANAEKFPYSVAAVLAPIVDHGQTAEQILGVCQRIVDEQFSRRAVEALVKKSAEGEKQKRKSALVSRPVKRGGVQIGALRTYANGALEFKLNGTGDLPSDAVNDLVGLLEATSNLLSDGTSDLRSALAAWLANADGNA
ncbi:MAG: ParB/RepB/Spo0J family partition protein [Burkholderiales bacterium]|nr:ParB/RepB/Spo0J family partition protein [Burkholderiales bacterium]